MRGPGTQGVNRALSQGGFVLFGIQHRMEQDGAVDAIGVLGPAFELLEIIPAARRTRRGERAQGRWVFPGAGGTGHGAHQIRVIAVDPFVGVNFLIGHGNFQLIHAHRAIGLYRVGAEQQ